MTAPIIAKPASDAGRPLESAEVAIVGGGAAGLATAIFVAREMRGNGERRVVVLDGARTLGAKILVSGGSRCNVMNARVDAGDFWRAGSPFVKQVLRAFTVPETIAFFAEIGVALKEEANGKLFPITNKSRTVLDALLGEARRLGVEVRAGARVTDIARTSDGWAISVTHGAMLARRVVLATGGLSLPKTGSDGAGYGFAEALGHTIVRTTPALDPLILAGDFHSSLSGIAHEAAIRITGVGMRPVEIRGSLLWTHFGISGPLALNASRFFHRGRADKAAVVLALSFVPELTAEEVDQRLRDAARTRSGSRTSTEIALAFGLPQAVAGRIAGHATTGDPTLGKLTREERRAVVATLTGFRLDVVDGRGYNFAEVTSGGVSLDEVNSKTMESRLVPGLHFVGEVLDVDGRIGGFNFQWAWSTARVAARAIARELK